MAKRATLTAEIPDHAKKVFSKEALQFIAEHILVDNPLPMRPELLRRVSSEHWMHWGADSGISESRIAVPYYAYVRAIQNIAISEAFGDGSRLRMIESNEALSGEDDKPLKSGEVFRTFTDAVWSDLKSIDAKENDDLKISTIRRNMQRTYLEYLVTIAVGPKSDLFGLSYAYFSSASQSYPADARSLARMHLKEIRSLIDDTLKNDKVTPDEISKAHLEEISDQLGKVLDAQVTAGDF